MRRWRRVEYKRDVLECIDRCGEVLQHSDFLAVRGQQRLDLEQEANGVDCMQERVVRWVLQRVLHLTAEGRNQRCQRLRKAHIQPRREMPSRLVGRTCVRIAPVHHIDAAFVRHIALHA